jgi:N-acetylneuraminate synthase
VTQAIFNDLFVLELANNHWGKLDRGLKIIRDFAEVVRANGVRASIKLQFRDVESFIHDDFRYRTDLRYIKKTRDTHMPWNQLRRMIEVVREEGMLTMVTPFDEISVDKCVEFDVDILKIASSDIRDGVLLRKIAGAGKPVIASSGGASVEHIDALVDFFAQRNIPFALNHCVSIYPSEDSELELNQIDFLRHRYPDLTIGLSTHEHRDWHDSVLMAYAKGARTFERHIDIDHEGVPVSPYCTKPEQADVWFKAFLKAKEMCGGSPTQKRVVPDKETRYLDALVRGVYARRDLPAGHVLSDDDIYLAVPLLRGQISGREFTGGERLKTALVAGESIDLHNVASAYSADPELGLIIADRGLERPEEVAVELQRVAAGR